MTDKTRNGILVTIGVLIGGYLLYTFIKKSNPNPNPNPNPNDPTDPTDPTDPDPTDPNPPNPSPDLTGNQVMKIANDLFEAMDNYGTDWDSSTGITSSFKKIKTNNDMDNLMSAFGTRTLNCGTANPFCSDFTGNLKECLRDELDEDEIAEVNDILRRNGVSRSI
jgi:hypothetical protein